jgi:hypothetical protein
MLHFIIYWTIKLWGKKKVTKKGGALGMPKELRLLHKARSFLHQHYIIIPITHNSLENEYLINVHLEKIGIN